MIRDLLERWLIWWELDRPSVSSPRDGERGVDGGPHRRLRTPIDRALPPGRLPRLFTFLTDLDQQLSDEAPTARHVPSPELRRRTLEALRQSALTSADATPTGHPGDPPAKSSGPAFGRVALQVTEQPLRSTIRAFAARIAPSSLSSESCR